MNIFHRYQNLFEELARAYKETNSRDRKLQILSLSPYTINKTIEKFETTNYMVKKSRKLKEEFGILPIVPGMSKGRVITEEIKLAVKSFYESDDISRICPGKRDCKVIRDVSGKKVTLQKRLILLNLKEAHKIFKDNAHNPQIGFSSFATLRPPNCVLAGSSGTHSVCVCTYHQNVKLQLSALHIKGLTYKHLIEKSVCSTDGRDCMMRYCSLCPGKNGLVTYYDSLEQMEEQPEEIRYKQWISTDRCTLIEKTEPTDEFLASLTDKVLTLSRHHFIAKSQSSFLKDLKETLPVNELIVIGDFSENYTFICQDAAQGFHWENSQCTLHPFVIYWKNKADAIKSQSYCFLSADTKHTTTMVYCFLEQLIMDIKAHWPKVTKLHYFTDGCAAQYKNKYNFINICHHMNDFNLSCEWHFFATSHGKNACDGIGGTVKRATARASLQRAMDKQILTPLDMFQFCKENLSQHIKFYFFNPEQITATGKKLKRRFDMAISITGTQKFHKYVPLNETTLRVYHLSQDTEGEERSIIKLSKVISKVKPTPKIGDYIVCSYGSTNWVGLVQEYYEAHDDFKIDFLYPSGCNKYYHFPTKRDICIIPQENVIGIVSTPILNQGTRIQYKFLEQELKQFIK